MAERKAVGCALRAAREATRREFIVLAVDMQRSIATLECLARKLWRGSSRALALGDAAIAEADRIGKTSLLRLDHNSSASTASSMYDFHSIINKGCQETVSGYYYHTVVYTGE